jgi:hypothetical protein
MVILGLLFVFQIKHWLADYKLQNRYMLGKFNADWSFFKPLAAHAGVHAAFTFAIATALVGPLLGVSLALFDGVTHFIIDRIKAGPKYLGRYNDKNTAVFWEVLGLDQMAHHMVHYIIIAVITFAMIF